MDQRVTALLDWTDSARRDLRVLGHGWTEIEPSDLVRDRAGGFLRAYPLRAADALQLAWADQPTGEATVITGSLFLVGDLLESLLPWVKE